MLLTRAASVPSAPSAKPPRLSTSRKCLILHQVWRAVVGHSAPMCCLALGLLPPPFQPPTACLMSPIYHARMLRCSAAPTCLCSKTQNCAVFQPPAALQGRGGFPHRATANASTCAGTFLVFRQRWRSTSHSLRERSAAAETRRWCWPSEQRNATAVTLWRTVTRSATAPAPFPVPF
jgi:hypothetical protein